MTISDVWSVDESTFREYVASMLDSIDDVVGALGGPSKVAELCGVRTSAVSNWSKRGRISRGSFMIVRDALASLGKEASPSVFGFKEPVSPDGARA